MNRTTVYSYVTKLICEPNIAVHVVIAIIAVIIGFFLNSFDKMPLFWIKGLFGFVIYLVLSYIIRYTEQINQQLQNELTGDPLLSKCQMKYSKKIHSNCNIILCIISCVYFSTISVYLAFVKFSPIGIYSVFALVIIVFMAFMIFQSYIHVIFLLYSISKIKSEKVLELFPEETKWFNSLEELSGKCRNYFIILGSLFILLFLVFSPVNSIQIIFWDGVANRMFLPLLGTWIIILVAIVFMIPFSSFARGLLLHRIYDNLVTQSLNNYKGLYEKCSEEHKIVYIDIMFRIKDRKYKLRSSSAWVIPVLASLFNFTSVLLSILSDLKSIGALG